MRTQGVSELLLSVVVAGGGVEVASCDNAY